MVKKRRKIWIILGIIAAVILAGALGLKLYAKDYYKATATAAEAIAGNEDVIVTKERLSGTLGIPTKYYLMKNRDDSVECKGGIIFYPGAKVEETAYAPLLSDLVEEGYEVFLMRMPMHLAIFGRNAADLIIREYNKIEHWTMMGHSLGGAMAADYTASHTESIENLVLLAAYSTKDLSSTGVRVLQIYGSEDGVLNRDSLKKYAKNLPEDSLIYEIEGGNHAGFAYYGDQKGDNEANITRQEQIQVLLDEFNELMREMDTRNE